MSSASPSRKGWLRRSAVWSTAWLLNHGQRPYAIWSLSAICTLDGFLPMVPAELMAFTLMILQPRRVFLVVSAFAISAAISAGLLATLVASFVEATALIGWLERDRHSPGWSQVVSLIQTWGAPVLALAAVFPDSPRTSIAVAALAGFAPIEITAFVLAGKLLLYGMILLVVQYMPKRWPAHHHATWPGSRHLRRAVQRFAALHRWVNRRSTQRTTTGEK